MPFPHLFRPLEIKSLKLANRIVMPPMATNYASPEGFVTPTQIDHYTRRARGGVGYITVEHTGILAQGKASPKMLLISSDEHAAKLAGLVSAVHEAGGRIVVQINHAGRQTSSAITGSPIVGPSAVPVSPAMETPRALTREEIEDIITAFVEAAARVKQAGADGVELHMAHGYLLCSFLSPFSNKREDEYGCDLAGRVRLPLQVLKSVRQRVGPDFPIICRLSGDEYVQGGLGLEETRKIARWLENEGADALHISACNAASVFLNHPPYYVEEGVFVHLAAAVKSEVKIPVIAVGRIRKPDLAEKIVAGGQADLVSMGRALLADPDLPVKAQQGRSDQIVPCISCNKCIQTLRQGSVSCTVNPETGHEAELRLTWAEQPKTVWVVGGGPGGLKAAEAAAIRGHRVRLIEKQDRLGGRVRLGAMPPHKEVLNEFIDYLEKRVRSLKVTVETGRTFELGMLDQEKPDALILAAGASPTLPDWPGLAESGALTVDQVLSGQAETGSRILIVGGGGNGCELADLLSEQGKNVTVIEMLPDIASDLVVHLQHYLKKRLKEKGVVLLTSTRVTALGPGQATVEGPSGTALLDGFDSLVLALGGDKPNDESVARLKELVPQVLVIGDASRPRAILEAVYEGQAAAREI